MNNIRIAVSGGLSSAVMAHHIYTSEKYRDYNKLFVFANTGREREETLEFLRDMQIHWGIPIIWIENKVILKKGVGIRHQIVNFETASRNGEPFIRAIQKYNLNTDTGLPNKAKPYCTRIMKIDPMNSLAKDIFNGEPYLQAIGYRYEDMPRRISWPEIETEKNKIFPLITDFDTPRTQAQVKGYVESRGIKLGIPSSLGNCDLCFKKSDKKLIEAIRAGADPSFFLDLEKEYNDTFLRGRRSFSIIEALARHNQTLDLFDDSGEGCFCGA